MVNISNNSKTEGPMERLSWVKRTRNRILPPIPNCVVRFWLIIVAQKRNSCPKPLFDPMPRLS